jgi:hypothetical protein
MAVVGVLFLVGLVLTGEFTREDLAAVKRIVRRKAA